MDRIPFGIPRLDSTIGGGAPPGSVVLLSGEAGAGASEFMYTAVLMNALARADPELFDLYYGDLGENTVIPEEVHYVSFTDAGEQIRDEMSFTVDDEIIESAVENTTFHDLSPEYFRLSPVPKEWYSDRIDSISDLGDTTARRNVAEALGDRLTEHASGNLVAIDSVTDLLGISDAEVSWNDVPVVLKGIGRAASEWGGLVLVRINRNAVDDTRHGQLVDSVDGTMVFNWESGGSTRDRTLVVKQFDGVLSRIEAEDIVQFETEIGDSGFDISDVRKIR
ncbi:RAD55 family ATPase [Natronomonas sp.]|uniref:RAD55 family ATPase n=1 Tax=Natronomonas sp. TaxID=2184060 RepID=UPI00262B120B|nr:HTR-like protein [Natronomonas sp.]